MRVYTFSLLTAFLGLGCQGETLMEPDVSAPDAALTQRSDVMSPRTESGPTPTHNRPTPVAARANQHSGVGQSPRSTTGQTSRAERPEQTPTTETCDAEVERLLKDLQDFEVQRASTPAGGTTFESLRSAHASLSNRLGKQQNGTLSASCRERLLTAEMGFKRRPLPPSEQTKDQGSLHPPPTEDHAQEDQLMRRLLCMQACSDRPNANLRTLCIQNCQRP